MRGVVIAAAKSVFAKGKREANFIAAYYLYIFGAAVYTDGLAPTFALYLKDVASGV